MRPCGLTPYNRVMFNVACVAPDSFMGIWLVLPSLPAKPEDAVSNAAFWTRGG